MKKIISIIKQIETTSGTNDKIAIIKKNSDNEMFKNVLKYTYDNTLMYGFSEGKLRELLENKSIETAVNPSCIFELLDVLAVSNINDTLRNHMVSYLKMLDSEERELYIKILTKDLKCNISAKTINKAIPKLISTWDIQQAYPIEKVKLKKDEWIALSLKLNGVRGSYFKGEFKSRQNKLFSGLEHIIKDIESLRLGEGYFIDGELIRNNKDNIPDNENFRLTTSILNSDSDKSDIKFVIFDIITNEDFLNKESKSTFSERLEMIEAMKTQRLNNVDFAPIYYTGTDHSQIEDLLDVVDKKGLEGLMCLRDMPYKCKRNNGILKVKKFSTVDCVIKGYEEGDSKYKGMLGAFIVEYKGNSVNVGSGFTDEQRQELWEIRDNMIGKILEVKYKEESMDKKTGLYSLQFPVFVCIREDKTEESFN